MPEFRPINAAENYFAGRAYKQREDLNALAMREGEQSIADRKQRNALAQRELDEGQKKQAATMIVQAAQYGLQMPNPKAFMEQNYPQIVRLAGPEWATADDATVKRKLQEAIGIYGPVAGIGPPDPRGQGAMYKYRNDAGEGIYGSAEDVRGKPIYDAPEETRAPSGYRFNGGRLEPIPGGPADPTTPSTRDDTRIFAKADKLRDEFNAQSKDFVAVGDSYNTVRAAAQDPTAAGDLSLIFAYMKMLDPNSVVREQEFANAQNAAGVPDRIRNQWNKILEGERLNPAQREDFINQAKKVYEIRKTRNQALVKRYSDIAKRNKVNPDDVVGDLAVFDDQQAPASAAPASAGGWSITPVK